MNISLKTLLSFDVNATDGALGHIQDVLFDDDSWTIRYVNVDTQRWRPLSKKVLVTPVSLKLLDTQEETLDIKLSKQQILDCPSIEEHQPISRKYEQIMFDFFGYGYYWNGLGLWGDFHTPTALAEQYVQKEDIEALEDTEDTSPNLRSTKELKHYDLVESDGMKGHVTDFIVDADTWSILYIVIDTRNWLPGGKKVMIPISHLQDISWKDQAVYSDIKVKDLERIPAFDEGKINNNEFLTEIDQALKN
ncbi:PRC-barrel domain-containing protein [Glaciecola sp. 1036]|uniref:PRC-barrel domain-containing protein n=1 Tax=Alteromonadaceae TaxID=72275 RepID=UPI003CFE4E45